MRKRSFVLIALVFALIICATIQPAIAYFTTYVRAKGGHQVTLGDTTTITEKYRDWVKEVSITNKEGSEPVFIRAKVVYTGLSGNEGFTVSGGGWTGKQADGYYYFGASATELTAVGAGESTTVLSVQITDVPEKPRTGDNFSVTVVYESTPVRYNAAGAAYADWDAKIIEIGSTTGGNG